MTARPGFIRAFSSVSLGTTLSRILGLVRELVFAYLFGASMAADAFFAAFRIPNMLRDLFAEGALASAFVPVFKQELTRHGKVPAFHLARVALTTLIVILVPIIIVGALLAPYLVLLIAPGFGDIPGKAELTAHLTALMFPFLLLVALAAFTMSMLNSLDHFAVPAAAPALFNVSMIGAAFLLTPYFDPPIIGMAIGVLIGGLGQLAVQLPLLYRKGFRFSPVLDLHHPGLRQTGRLMGPMVGGLAAGRVNIFVNTLLASLMVTGAVSYLNYAYRLMHLPLGVIAVALGTVALPRASAQAAENDLEGLRQTFYRTVRYCFFLVTPVAALFATCGDIFIGLLFEHGKFTAADTVNTHRALIWYSFGLIGYSGVRVTAPMYYALKDSVVPMRISIIAVAVNLAANFLFIPFLGFAGLAAATSLGGIVNFILLVWFMPKRIIGIDRAVVFGYFMRAAAASVGAALGAYYLARWDMVRKIGSGLVGDITTVIVIVFAAGVGYAVLSYFFGNLPQRLRRPIR